MIALWLSVTVYAAFLRDRTAGTARIKLLHNVERTASANCFVPSAWKRHGVLEGARRRRRPEIPSLKPGALSDADSRMRT
jgi:hypothetical protein